jgi:hypothetical protein
MWQEQHLCHKRGKGDILVENVARETLQNVAIETSIFTNVARMTSMSQTWQERRSGGKCGKRDVNVERETSTWKDRRYRAT